MTISDLKNVQTNFQHAILHHSQKVNVTLTTSSKFSVYQNGYHERIISAMKQDFPVIHALLGDRAFSGLVCDYIDAYPSHHFSLRYIGEQLSTFLIQKDLDFAPFSDLAKWEWIVCQSNFKKVKHHFTSAFNVISVWKSFHEENKLIAFQKIYC